MHWWVALTLTTVAFAQPALQLAITPPPGVTVSSIASSADGTLYAAGKLHGDAIVVRFDDAGHVVWQRTVGGSANDEAKAVTLDAQGSIYLAGETASANFPAVNALLAKSNLSAQVTTHGFLVKLSAAGEIVYSTYYYKEGRTSIGSVRALPSGEVLLAGGTSKAPMPPWGPPWHGFVAKFSAKGDRVLFHTEVGGDQTSCSGGSSCIGATPSTTVRMIDVRPNDGWILMAGSTNSTGMATADAVQRSCNCVYQAGVGWLGLLDSDGVPRYVTYLSGRRVFPLLPFYERLHAASFDLNGDIRTTGVTRSPGFPTTPEAHQQIIDDCPTFCAIQTDVSFYGWIDGMKGTLRGSSLFGGRAASLRASWLDPSGGMWMMGDQQPFLVLMSADASNLEGRWPAPGQDSALVSLTLPDGVATGGPMEIRRYRWVTDGPRIYAVGRGQPTRSVVEIAAGDVLDVYSAGYSGEAWLYFDGILAEATRVQGEPGHWRAVVPAGVSERTVIELTLLTESGQTAVSMISTR